MITGLEPAARLSETAFFGRDIAPPARLTGCTRQRADDPFGLVEALNDFGKAAPAQIAPQWIVSGHAYRQPSHEYPFSLHAPLSARH
jgi:hypothetical protein